MVVSVDGLQQADLTPDHGQSHLGTQNPGGTPGTVYVTHRLGECPLTTRMRTPCAKARVSAAGRVRSLQAHTASPRAGARKASPPSSDECPLSAGRPGRLRRRSLTATRPIQSPNAEAWAAANRIEASPPFGRWVTGYGRSRPVGTDRHDLGPVRSYPSKRMPGLQADPLSQTRCRNTLSRPPSP
jgi:hypothetical protein